MNYAIRNDKQAFRAVGSRDDVGSDEYWSQFPIDIVPLPPTATEVATAAIAKRNELLAIAANRMGPLQDAVDVERVTDDEVALLKLWKAYRIDLNRIEQQDGFPAEIQWPVSPDEKPPELAAHL
ncbi:tail fiber assembly protein [Pseudomonas sp. P7548]|uniref:tail fiber assembly protein n=1 Tax=Pseudomonas sp. P7548 TaxID=2726981 RepID=UPI0015BB1688|nr:tail fiber assembly protein [Pseudomonas sp. P7548]NWE20204.1 tail fiber assembly protein [Pseudomonas sp. P7548]